MRAGINAIAAAFNETPTGEETFLTLRHMARSFEPEPVTVIGPVIIVDERKGWTNYFASLRCRRR